MLISEYLREKSILSYQIQQMSFQKLISGLACFSFILFLAAFISPQAGLKPAGRINNIQDTIPVTDTTDMERIFDKVDIEASYPGGDKAWRRFLESNLDPTVATRNKAPVGVYTVIIQFVVDKEGRVTDIKPLTNQGYGMEKEVIRLLKKAPRWKPAIQTGRPVKAYRRQPVTFMVMDEKKNRN